MVKITFQSVAGQKVEKENDGDKSEILIPHAVVSVFLTRFISIIVREKKPACLSSAYRPTYTCAAMISWWGWGGGGTCMFPTRARCTKCATAGCGLSSPADGLEDAGSFP